ncbi:MAG: sulfatase-like hydrolase/transferase [Actinomycetota bacterium]|nr:sulfatase-like hydrolase/transferase [Actinomycetota bacterium]
MKFIGSLRTLLSHRDWVYLLSLLVPLVVYNLTLKAYAITSQPGNHGGLAQALDLIWADVFFNLGYTLLWIGLFAVVRRRPLRLVVIFLFHATTMLVVVTTTVAHYYFLENGATLDYGTIAEWIPKFEEIVPILFQGGVPLLAWMLLASALLYVAFGPLFVARTTEWWRGWPKRRFLAAPAETSFLGSLGLFLLALGFGSLSLLTGTTTLARAPFVNVVLTGIEQVTIEEDISDAGQLTEHPAAHASLGETFRTEKRNVVLIHLESTRAQSVTPYNEDLKTTPYLDELAKESLLVERAYVVVPRSSKATLTVNCGIDPPLYQGPEFDPGGIPVPCLASLLKDQGYSTVFFQSSSETMDQYGIVAENLGYEEYYPSESMNTEGFEATNYISYEDDIMLKPSEQWLKEHKDEPFLAQYLTGTGHDDYRCLSTRYGSEHFTDDDLLNRYLNCLRLQDIFLENLFDQYRELGLYEDTIFVIYGDHGEGFGEHGRFLHGDTPWEEGLRVPLIIHDPKQFKNGERVEGLWNQTDILPTAVEMLGYEVKNGEYPGYSLLRPLPGDRTLRFSCISSRKCLASINGDEKYIYHYDNQLEEIFDLSEDPSEEHNLADEYSKEELDRRREDLFQWLSSVNSQYGGDGRG